MGTTPYLAMTPSEIAACSVLPQKVAWMACSFAPDGKGIARIPSSLPPDSLLILNDRIPVNGHDPHAVAEQLAQAAKAVRARGVLLDLERVPCPESRRMAEKILTAVPCPAAVPPAYAEGLSCPVFLPPVPAHQDPLRYLAPWHGREIWLDICPGGETVTVTPEGSKISAGQRCTGRFRDRRCFCRYDLRIRQDQAIFSLCRTREDLEQMLDALGSRITCAVGLFRELGRI